jgi:hypothetical protein
VGGGVQLGPLGTGATNGLLCQPRVIMMMKKLVEWLGNRSTRRKPAPVTICPPQTPTCYPDTNPGRRGGKPASNRLSYGTAFQLGYYKIRILKRHNFRYVNLNVINMGIISEQVPRDRYFLTCIYSIRLRIWLQDISSLHYILFQFSSSSNPSSLLTN